MNARNSMIALAALNGLWACNCTAERNAIHRQNRRLAARRSRRRGSKACVCCEDRRSSLRLALPRRQIRVLVQLEVVAVEVVSTARDSVEYRN
jgi:hypothetical protein